MIRRLVSTQQNSRDQGGSKRNSRVESTTETGHRKQKQKTGKDTGHKITSRAQKHYKPVLCRHLVDVEHAI